MIPLADTAAPAWLPAIFLLVPVCLVAFGIRRGMGIRANLARAATSPLRTRHEHSFRPGDTIPDGGVVPFMDLLEALAVVPFEDLGGSGHEGDDPWTAALGLSDHDYSTTFGEIDQFHLASGERHGRQVILRRGQDEVFWGSSTAARHNLHQLLVRAEFPSFELIASDRRLTAFASAPSEVSRIFGGLARSDAWSSLRAIAGPEGILFVRPAEQDLLGGFAYDLWFGERLADVLDAPTLASEPVDSRFRLPYSAGRGTSLVSAARRAITH